MMDLTIGELGPFSPVPRWSTPLFKAMITISGPEFLALLRINAAEYQTFLEENIGVWGVDWYVLSDGTPSGNRSFYFLRETDALVYLLKWSGG